MSLTTDWKRYGVALDQFIAQFPKWKLGVLCYALSALVVVIQLVGQIPLTVFYAIPITLLAWYAGSMAAFCLAITTMVVSISVNYFSGVLPNIMAVLVGLIRFSFYVFLSIAIPAFRSLQAHLHAVASERELALATEIAAHRRLEQEMLDSAERKQRGIGRDLHDGLSQHLIATAMVSYAHAQKLSADRSAEADKAYKIVDLVEQAIALARAISEALHPIEMSGDDLMSALEKFAATTSELFGIQCRFECHVPVILDAPSTAEHLFRITQEAVSNAIRHGHATKIEIALQEIDTGLKLSVADNGSGLPNPLPERKGMGLKIMAARSQFIGGQISLLPKDAGGTNIVCLVPAT